MINFDDDRPARRLDLGPVRVLLETGRPAEINVLGTLIKLDGAVARGLARSLCLPGRVEVTFDPGAAEKIRVSVHSPWGSQRWDDPRWSSRWFDRHPVTVRVGDKTSCIDHMEAVRLARALRNHANLNDVAAVMES